MMRYDAKDHYWVVGGDDEQVYCSALGDYVPVDDGIYVAWLADDGWFTRIGTAFELGEVLAAAKVTPPPVAPDVLAGYQDALAAEITTAANADFLLSMFNQVRVLQKQPSLDLTQFHEFIKANHLT